MERGRDRCKSRSIEWLLRTQGLRFWTHLAAMTIGQNMRRRHDKRLDRYIAPTDQSALLFISGERSDLSEVRAPDMLPGFSRLLDRGNSRHPRIEVAPDGKSIALVAFFRKSVKSVWQYDAESQTARLTFKSHWR